MKASLAERGIDLSRSAKPETKKSQRVVMKFGGFCMATADNIRRSADIVLKDQRQLAVVVSAPGKRPDVEGDPKITDLLLSLDPNDQKFEQRFGLIESRYMGIASDLFENNTEHLDQVRGWISDAHRGIIRREGGGEWRTEWVGSRGEWLMGKIFSLYLQIQSEDRSVAFADPAEFIKISVSPNKKEREILPQTYGNINHIPSDADITVIPGYYGSDENGNIVTLGRGGSDATATAWAVGFGAQTVEMFKDVPVLAADPRVIPNATVISHMTVSEITEMAFRGADVLQARATAPLLTTDREIPVYIKGLSKPDDLGTQITRRRKVGERELAIGIAQKGNGENDDFLAIQVRKLGIDTTPHIVERVLEIFGRHDASIDHLPTDNNSVTVFVQRRQLNGGVDDVVKALEAEIKPDELVVHRDLGVVCVVGEGIRRKPTEALATVFSALDRRNIQAKAAVYGPGSNNIVFAVDKKQLKPAIEAVYQASVRRAA